MEEYKFITLNNTKLFVMKSGLIFRLNKKNKKWMIIKNVDNRRGYNSFQVGPKHLYRHRVLGFAFLALDIENKKHHIDHIDGNRLNNNVLNLRIVSQQQNNWNQTNAKGYCWHKRRQQYQAYINLNNKPIHLGYFITEEEARQAYLNAKLIYHKIE